MNLRVVWKFAVVECGAQSVMMDGEMLMPGLYVGNLDMLRPVIIVKLLIYISSIIVWILQELLLEVKLSTVKAVVTSY